MNGLFFRYKTIAALRFFLKLVCSSSYCRPKSWPGASESIHCRFSHQRMNNILICALVIIWVKHPSHLSFGSVVMTNIGIPQQWEEHIGVSENALHKDFPVWITVTQIAALGSLIILSAAPGCRGSDRWACAQEQGDFGGSSCGSGWEPTVTWKLNSRWRK